MWRKTADSREEMPEYVERSYHEALVNALAHRDYLVNGSEVHIDIYDDRMEIWNVKVVDSGKSSVAMNFRLTMMKVKSRLLD